MSRLVSAMLDELSNSKTMFNYFHQLDVKVFHHVKWSFLRSKPSTRDILVLKVRQPLINSRLTCGEDLYSLHYGKMMKLSSDAIPIGYVFNLPRMSLTLNREYVVMHPGSANLTSLKNDAEILINVDDLEVFLVDKTVQILSTFNSGLLPPLF